MPIYQYKCQKCFSIHEVMQGINEPPLTECVSCNGNLKKIISPAGIIFKGSGFHVNDYKGSTGTAASTSSNTSTSSSDSDSKKNNESSTTGDSSSKAADTSAAA